MFLMFTYTNTALYGSKFTNPRKHFEFLLLNPWILLTAGAILVFTIGKTKQKKIQESTIQCLYNWPCVHTIK